MLKLKRRVHCVQEFVSEHVPAKERNIMESKSYMHALWHQRNVHEKKSI